MSQSPPTENLSASDANRAVRAHVLPTTLVLIAGVLWSFSGVLIKSIHWNAWAIAGTRSMIGCIFQFGFLLFVASRPVPALSGSDVVPVRAQTSNARTNALRLTRQILLCQDRAHWLGATFFVINMIALVFAFQLTKAANAVFLHYAGLVLVAVFSGPILKQFPTRQDWIAVSVGLAGMLLIASDALDPRSVTGTALGIVCGISLALCQICLGLRSQRKVTGTEALETIFLANLIMFLIGMPFMLAFHGVSSHDVVFLVLLGVVPWAVPDILYSISIKSVPILRALILGLLDPILTAVWPFFIMAEVPSLAVLTGATLASVAVVYQNIYEQSKLKFGSSR